MPLIAADGAPAAISGAWTLIPKSTIFAQVVSTGEPITTHCQEGGGIVPSVVQAYWYGSIFLAVYFTGIGIPPIPEEVMIISSSGVCAAKDLQWWWAWPATILGIVCADATLYGLGRAWGPKLFEYRWVQRLIKAERRQRIEKSFEEHGIKILLTARLLPPLRSGVFLIAGAIRYPFARFVLADLAYAIVGVGFFFFGSQALISLLLQVGHWAVYLAAVGIVGFLLYRYYRHLQARELRGAAKPPISILEVPAPVQQPPDVSPEPSTVAG
jgi:membrane protein DedA with SNARE-associated domain